MVYTAVPPDYCDNDVEIIVQQALSAVNFLEKACTSTSSVRLTMRPQESHHDTGRGALRMTTKARPHDGGNREMLRITACTVRRRGGGVAKPADRAALGPCDAVQLSAAHSAAGETWHTGWTVKHLDEH